jgi:hypothetical protein
LANLFSLGGALLHILAEKAPARVFHRFKHALDRKSKGIEPHSGQFLMCHQGASLDSSFASGNLSSTVSVKSRILENYSVSSISIISYSHYRIPNLAIV